jgi:methylglutaconyl-CoA hydratase
VNIGFVPALVSVFLVRQVGDRRARELLLSGRIVKADEAARLGLITEVVAADKLLLRAHDLAARVASHSPASLRETKALLNGLAGLDLDRALAEAADLSARIRQTGDFKEGLSAFLEKRRPVWHPR